MIVEFAVVAVVGGLLVLFCCLVTAVTRAAQWAVTAAARWYGRRSA